MKLIVHAPNVHQGGGRAILKGLMESLRPGLDGLLLCDERLQGVSGAFAVERFSPTIAGRWAAEQELKRRAQAEDLVLCMGNLPPLFTLPCRTFLFLQNRYLCDTADLRGFPARVRLRIAVERLWLRRCASRVTRILVQTPSMADLVKRRLGFDAAVVPFAAPAAAAAARPAAAGGVARFLYPASGEPHKNHERLLEAWRLLRAEGVEAELHLTVGEAALAERIGRCAREGLSIVNHGHVDAQKLHELYAMADALLYPSLFESFGMPLVEARALGLPIVAAERDYVRDVVMPAETFDPESPRSIARAVRRFLGAAEPPATILTPEAFLDRLLSGRI